MQTHKKKVTAIQNQVRARSGTVALSSKAVSNTLRKRSHQGIDLSPLNEILEIGDEWVLVEPRVTFQQLCKETLKSGLLPPVVPEFMTITVGGAILGAALESSSHRFGQVSDTCIEYEVVLGNGECVHATAEENSDLFYGLSGSYGTLGVLTKVKLRLIKAQNYVSISCTHLSTDALFSFLTCEQRADFIEGIAFSKESGIALTGKMTAHQNAPLFRQNRYWSPWYIHYLAKSRDFTFCMPIEEYLFRSDRGAFWMGRYALSLPTMVKMLASIGKPKLSLKSLYHSLFFRLLFGWALSSKRLYSNWHRLPKNVSERLFFVHDFYAPQENAQAVFESFTDQTEIFPVWLCPIKGTTTAQLLAPHYGQNRYINIGLYGMPNSSLSTPELSAKLENEIALFQGRKMLYSYTYYDRESFSKIYDEERYAALRKKFFAEEAFPHIYNKLILC